MAIGVNLNVFQSQFSFDFLLKNLFLSSSLLSQLLLVCLSSVLEIHCFFYGLNLLVMTASSTVGTIFLIQIIILFADHACPEIDDFLDFIFTLVFAHFVQLLKSHFNRFRLCTYYIFKVKETLPKKWPLTNVVIDILRKIVTNRQTQNVH